jgi:beta-glucosidase
MTKSTFLLSLSLFALASGSCRADTPKVIIDATTKTVKTPAYQTRVDAQGALPSFKIGDQEFFKSEAGIPHGGYLYQDGPVWLPEIEQTAPHVVLAKSPKAIMRYEFAADSVTVTVANATDKGMNYYVVLDPAVDTLFNNEGQGFHPFVNQGGQATTTWFSGKNKLKIEGGDGVFGPWQDKYQVWSLGLEPKATRTVVFSASQATAEDSAKISALATNPNILPQADIASPKLGKDGNLNPDFQRAHREYLQRIQAGPIGLLFIGDSITNRWRTVNELWTERFGPYQPANFGIEGDRTEHVLWRFDNGELDGIDPKVVVVMIGTNNMGYPTEEIIKGDQKVVSEIHRRLPGTKVLLLGIFPRGTKPTDGVRAKVKAINEQLAKLDDGNKTRFLDIGSKLLDSDGNLTPEIAPDALHLSPKGYQIWADAMQPLLDKMLK